MLLRVLALATALRPAERAEGMGLDQEEHGEEAYTTGEGAILVLPDEALPGADRAPAGVPMPAPA